jgi:hypothetical protein
MRKNSALTIMCTLIFLTGIIALLLGHFRPGSEIPGWTLLAVAIIYLLSGWNLFKGYYPDGHPLLLFFMGYLYAAVFISFTFIVTGWPLATTMITIAPLWATLQILVAVAVRKKLPKDGFIQFLIEGGLMLVLSVFILIRG